MIRQERRQRPAPRPRTAPFFVPAIAALLIASACGGDGTGPTGSGPTLPAPYAGVDVDYLPWEYLPDGCMQRASYIGMELALRGVPTIAVDAETCDYGMGLSGPGGEPWRHHTVAAVLRDGGEPALIDPLASPDFLAMDAWLAGMTDDPVRVFLTSIAYPTSHDHETGCGSVTTAVDPLPSAVADMTPWLLENILSDCAALRQFHRDSPAPDPAREARLVARTAELAKGVKALGLLDESMSPGTMDRLEQGPWCPEPVPK